MSKISQYPDGSPVQSTDLLVISRPPHSPGDTFNIPATDLFPSLLIATLDMSSAQILALGTGPEESLTIVQGVAGKIIWPISFYAQYDFGTIAYTADGSPPGSEDGNGGFYYQTSRQYGWLDPGNADNTAPMVGLALIETQDSVSISSPVGSLITSAVSSNVPGASLLIAAPGGGYSDGDGTIRLSVVYALIPSVF